MKNVLVIVYYFPPMGGSGVQRPLKFIKYLREFGWNPIVLCPEPGAYHVFDESLNNELKSLNVDVHRVEGNTPLHKSGNRLVSLPSFAERFLRKVSQFFWIPDNKKGWIKPGFKKAKEIISTQKIDLIFSTAPPYSNLVLATMLKKDFDIPIVMDLRDDWLNTHLVKYPTRWHFSKMRTLELETLNQADQIITINELIAESIESRIDNSNKVEVISHGFDLEDFRDGAINSVDSKKITFLYSGTFYPESGPEMFIEVMALFLEENPTYKDKVVLQFQGNLGNEFDSLFKKYGIQKNVHNFGFIPHLDAVQNLLNADILWLNNSHKKNPQILSLGKTYEYMASKKPIIAMIPKGTLRNTLEKYGAAFISDPENLVDLKNNIEKVIRLFEQNKLPIPDQKFIYNFDRRMLTKRLSSIFNVISNK
ncbi:MAG: glycosyltransferase family 4 protein [Balneolaceae bacterium]